MTGKEEVVKPGMYSLFAPRQRTNFSANFFPLQA
jgi:hypothetical protein